MDRLKEVEGKATSGRTRGGHHAYMVSPKAQEGESVAQASPPASSSRAKAGNAGGDACATRATRVHHLPKRTRPTVPLPASSHYQDGLRSRLWLRPRITAYCVLAGGLVLLSVFLLWAPWRSQSPKTIAAFRGGGQVISLGKRILRRVAADDMLNPATKEILVPSEKTESRHVHHVGTDSSLTSFVQAPGPASESGLMANAAARLSAPPERGGSELPGAQEPTEADAPGTHVDSKGADASVPAAEVEISGSSPLANNESPQKDAGAAIPPESKASTTLTREEDEANKNILRSLKVSGVYRDAGGHLAFIDGREFKPGQKLGQLEIAAISSEQITFVFKAKRYNLRIR